VPGAQLAANAHSGGAVTHPLELLEVATEREHLSARQHLRNVQQQCEGPGRVYFGFATVSAL
jgi:hypothetical protein